MLQGRFVPFVSTATPGRFFLMHHVIVCHIRKELLPMRLVQCLVYVNPAEFVFVNCCLKCFDVLAAHCGRDRSPQDLIFLCKRTFEQHFHVLDIRTYKRKIFHAPLARGFIIVSHSQPDVSSIIFLCIQPARSAAAGARRPRIVRDSQRPAGHAPGDYRHGQTGGVAGQPETLR